ncbi:hypothetical protein RN001_004592 [Aquatica leii]|uniref:Major facilitator superfamily (MFS) profile domain-containing protein n=1 Tax=Aquatica leii TaxID=1421715 RepID=A0AAN7PBU1_9COLE|nr:hypothetical protein RN001_004592 [Aquatica leii]
MMKEDKSYCEVILCDVSEAAGTVTDDLLPAEYHKCKRHNGVSGNDPGDYECYTPFDEILRHRPSVQSLGFDSSETPEVTLDELQLIQNEDTRISIEMFEDAPDVDGAIPGCSKTPGIEMVVSRESSPSISQSRMAFGGFFFSSVSDITGRKCMIPMSLMMIFGSTFACGFAHGPVMIITCVFILGAGLVANANSVKIHLSEILPANKRGFFLTFQDIFWTIGYVTGALTAWLLTPTIILQQNKEMRLATWRLIFGLSGVSSIVVACASALLLPSPRFLLFSKKYPEALDTLKRMYAINNSKHCETYSVYQSDLYGCVDEFNMNNYRRPITCMEHIITIMRKMKHSVCYVLSKRFICVTKLLILYKFVVTFELIAVNIWLAKMLQHGNKSDCYFKAVDILHLEDGNNKCNENVSISLYNEFFVLAAFIACGQLILMLNIDRFGRRIAILSGCITCAATSFILGYTYNVYAVRLISAAGFMMAYSIIDSTLNIIIIESYPTALRGTAAGGIPFFARFASGFIKRFLEMPCQHSFIIMGTVMLGAYRKHYLEKIYVSILENQYNTLN